MRAVIAVVGDHCAIFTVEPNVLLPLLPQEGGGLQRQPEARAGRELQVHCTPCCNAVGLLRLGDGDEVADADAM